MPKTSTLRRSYDLDKSDLKFMLSAIQQKELLDNKTTDQSNRLCAMLRIEIEKLS